MGEFSPGILSSKLKLIEITGVSGIEFCRDRRKTAFITGKKGDMCKMTGKIKNPVKAETP